MHIKQIILLWNPNLINLIFDFFVIFIVRKLQNPKLPNYTNLKEFILGDNFPWFYNKHFVYKENKDYYIESDEKFSDISFYTHSFLNRPKHTGESIQQQILHM